MVSEPGLALFTGGGWLLPEGTLGRRLGPQEALLLRRPSRILAAQAACEVRPLLAEVGEEQARGNFVAGYLAYEAGAAFGLTVGPADGLPLAWMAIYPPECMCRLAAEEWAELIAETPAVPPAALPRKNDLRLNASPQEYDEAIAQVRELIAAGDTYQVNYTVRARFEAAVDPFAYFVALVRRQPVPYAAFLDLGWAQVLSLSPEQFLRRRGTLLESMPMKGTRPRHASLREDFELAWQLLASPKDRAENLMIVDMVRNDLGRVSRAGSVRVPALYSVEPYRTVWQMASTVTGQIRPEARPLELLAATFPGASITGAPKYHTMELIAQLESEPRGVYTGAVGLFLPVSPHRAKSTRIPPAPPRRLGEDDSLAPFTSGLSRSSGGEEHLAPDLAAEDTAARPAPGGDFTCNVAIRTLVHRGGEFRLGVGGGIVWDSESKDEYQEALNKAAFALLPAQGDWEAPSLPERVRVAEIGLFETLLLRSRSSFEVPEKQGRLERVLEEQVLEEQAGAQGPPQGELRRYSFLAAHLDRLAASATALGLPFDREDVLRILLELALSSEDALVVRVDLKTDGRLSTSARPQPAPFTRPLAVLVSPFRTDPYDQLLQHKTTARFLYDSEYQRAQGCGYQEALFLNQLGRVTEGAITNLFARFGGRWVTPPVSDGLLPGIWRAHYLAQTAASEQSLDLEELLAADEIVLGNSVRGLVPVGEIVVNDLRGLVPPESLGPSEESSEEESVSLAEER